MKMHIEGTGRLTLSGTVPDAILSGAYPYITAAVDSQNNILWLDASPYIEAYDEDGVRSFLSALLPYVKSGSMDYSLHISGGHAVHWSFRYAGGKLSRVHRAGSCSAYETIQPQTGT